MTAPGILNLNKPLGATSFDIVRDVRRGTGEKRVGHAGTLDPAATGVLLVMLGQASRVSEYIMDLRKTYRATIRLGVATTTYDSEGDVTATNEVDVTEAQIRDALTDFTGDIQQRPPAYSAVKVGGKRAYAMARRGEEVELKERPAQVYRLDVLSFAPPLLEIEVECGKGTYIRSLAHDLGQRLGCGAHLSALERTRVGPFSVEAAADEETLGVALADGTWKDLLQPIDCGLISLPALTMDIEDEKDLRHGQPVELDEETTAQLHERTDGLEARAYAENGSLIGIVRWDAEAKLWRPRKIFAPEGR